MSTFIAFLHYLGFGLAAAGLLIRGKGFRSRLKTTIYAGDNLWGIATLIVVASGLTRALGPAEKGWAYYQASPYFWVKIGLFGAIGVLETFPMISLIRSRMGDRQSKSESLPAARAKTFLVINTLEIILLFLIPPVAYVLRNGGIR